MELYHHGVKGMRWGYRKDESTVAKLRSKNEKLNIKLKKRKAKLDKFNQSRGSVIAKKAEIRMARHRRIGLIASHYLAKSKKLEYKVAKIDRKILRNNKKINKIINRANKNVVMTPQEKKDLFGSDGDWMHEVLKDNERMGLKPYVLERDRLSRATTIAMAPKKPHLK